MADSDPGVQTFFPYTRRGLATLPVDTLAAGMPGSASVAVELQVHNAQPVRQQFRIASPGDVTGFDFRQVIRTEPPDGTRNYEPNFLATVEFDRPDFPWLFTPASPDAQGRLRPWICLAVIRQQNGVSITAGPSGLSPVLDIRQPASAAVELPNLAESWAWAHAQVVGQVETSVDRIEAQNPERTLSRLMSPRRLDPNTAYFCCVVPAFEAGRKAGLGLPLTDADSATLLPSWTADTTSVQLPIYYLWQFQTGPSGDFASLVKLLNAYKFPDGSGTRSMFVGAAGQGLPAAAAANPQATVNFESALLPVDAKLGDWTGNFADGFRAALRKLIDVPVYAQADPLVAPPLYAGRHANQTPPLLNTAALWLSDLNLNPQNRAVAAYGTRVVQNEQEALMASAWDQAGDLDRANSILRQAQLVRRASESVHTNHVAKLTSGTLLQISRPVHTRIAVTPNITLRKQFLDTHVPTAVVSAEFRRASRPGGPVMRTVLTPQQRMTPTIVRRVAAGNLVVALMPRTYTFSTPEGVEQRFRSGGGTRPPDALPVNFLQMQVKAAATIPPRPNFAVSQPELPGVVVPPPPPPPPISFRVDSAQAELFRTALTAHQALLGPAFLIFAPLIPAVNVDTLKPALLSQIDPTTSIAKWVRPMIKVNGVTAANDALDPIAAAPQFPQPMYEALRDISQDLIVTGINDLPDNTVSPLKPNARFVEAFLAGLNHEMARELLWRGYPTDQRGTYFRNFWDRRGISPFAAPVTDIPEIHTWPPQKHLGQIADAGNSLVVLIRGEIIRRYPNAILSMVQATWPTGQPRPSLGTQEVHPVMRGTLGADIMFFGFPMTPQAATGAGSPDQPGWFFVIQEHPCAPRFGLEPDAPAGALQAGSNSAVTARTYLQPPVRLAIHARDLLAGT